MKNQIKNLLLIAVLLLITATAFSQKVSNVHFEQVGKEIYIYYDLIGENLVFVNVYCSQDNGKSWEGPLKEIRGAVGSEQQEGVNKLIVWDVLKEKERLQGSLSFEVEIVIDDVDEIDIAEQIHLVVEEMPSFPGGEAEMYNYIGKNIEYPQLAKESGISGRVFLSFVIEKDGSVTDVQILRGIGGGCDKEAARVIKSMPKWEPGIQRGKAVRVQYRMPIKFTLQDNNEVK